MESSPYHPKQKKIYKDEKEVKTHKDGTPRRKRRELAGLEEDKLTRGPRRKNKDAEREK
jgi:hypothetical protein